MPIELRYRGFVYRLEGGRWRGRDGHTVHLLTWVSDDLLRREAPPPGTDRDRWLAERVSATLGSEAEPL